MTFKKGHIAWNKGKTGVYSKETIEAIRNAHIGMKGTLWKEGRREIHGKFVKNNPNCIKGMFKKGNVPPKFKGYSFDKHGYIYIFSPNHPYKNARNNVMQHRLVVESQIGRYLFPKEVTHHLNEIHDDNRPENLMAFISNGIHMRFHHHPEKVLPEQIIFDGRLL